MSYGIGYEIGSGMSYGDGRYYPTGRRYFTGINEEGEKIPFADGPQWLARRQLR